VNYFIGIAICKLFAWEKLQVPWVLHLDVFRDQLNPILLGRSRPDLVGQIIGGGNWIVLEAKGRGTHPDNKAKQKAKVQAMRLQSINGQPELLPV
jgi:hypothetical protein